jgi:hypothetical protein
MKTPYKIQNIEFEEDKKERLKDTFGKKRGRKPSSKVVNILHLKIEQDLEDIRRDVEKHSENFTTSAWLKYCIREQHKRDKFGDFIEKSKKND